MIEQGVFHAGVAPNGPTRLEPVAEEWSNFHNTDNWDYPIQYPDYPGTGNWGDAANDYAAPIGPGEMPVDWNSVYYPGGAGPNEAPPGWFDDHQNPYDVYMNDVVNNMPIAPGWDTVNWNFPQVPTHPPGGMWGDEIMNLPEAPNNVLPYFPAFMPPAVNPDYMVPVAVPVDDYNGLVAPPGWFQDWQNLPVQAYQGDPPIGIPIGDYGDLQPVPPPGQGTNNWNNLIIGKS